MATILTTTGLSLYQNAKREYQTNQPTDDQMRQYLRTNPDRASSEANSLLKFAKPDDDLVLLHTQTPDAIRCTSLLHDYFSSKGYKRIRLVQLEFKGDAQHIETTGLRSLIDALINEIEGAQRKQTDVVINATAGFKAQVVYSTMIGMIYQVPVKYIHEEFRSLVTFNPIALEWDTSIFLTYEAFFKWIDAEPRTCQEVESYLKGLPDRERIEALLTSPDADGLVYLSYMGEALRRKFQRETEEAELVAWPPSADIKNPKDKIASSLLHRSHHPIKGGLAACHKIAELDCVQAIIGGNFENTTNTRLKVYPNGIILLLWADNEKAERLTIQTTAWGQPQTLKVAQKIKEILEIP